MNKGWRDGLLIGSVCGLLALTALVILSRMETQVQEDLQLKCDALDGKLVFYECMSSGDWFVEKGDRCVNKITGYACELPDGSEVQFHYDLRGELRP